jgi:hypothetical protein
MMGNAGKVLHTAARFICVCIGLWIVLSISPASAQTALAQDTSKMCFPQANQCGCATCGCEPDYGRPSCPPGSSLYDDYCLPDCPGDFIRYPGQPGLCMPPCQHGCPEGYDQVPLPQCPENYVRDLRDPDNCIPDYDRMRNFDNCAQGQSYNSRTGQCEFDCLEGYYLDSQGQCQFNYDKECRQGYTRDLRSGKCVPTGDWPPNYEWICLPTCPQGTYRDIQYPTRCLPPPPQCDDGYTNENGRCVPVCEPGSLRDRYGYCVPQTCPDGKYPNIRGQCRDPECPRSYVRDDFGNCQPPEQGCREGTTFFNGQCMPDCGPNEERDENGRCLPGDRGCERGEEEVNGQCEPLCKAGLKRDANGRCVPERQGCRQGTVAFRGKCVDICKQGTRRNADGRCVAIVQPCGKGEFRDKNGRCRAVERDPVCPRGSRPDGQGGCIKVETLVPQGCREGTVYNRRSKKCEPIRRARPQPDPEFEDDGDTFEPPVRRPNIQLNPELLELMVPKKRPQSNQQEDCPKGMFRDNNGRCVEG